MGEMSWDWPLLRRLKERLSYSYEEAISRTNFGVCLLEAFSIGEHQDKLGFYLERFNDYILARDEARYILDREEDLSRFAYIDLSEAYRLMQRIYRNLDELVKRAGRRIGYSCGKWIHEYDESEDVKKLKDSISTLLDRHDVEVVAALQKAKGVKI